MTSPVCTSASPASSVKTWKTLFRSINPSDFEPQDEPTRRPRKQRKPAPDGLRTASEAAARLGCSVKTLNGHVAAGALRYVVIGHGSKRPRKMFTDSDLNAFIADQTRKDSPCPSTASRARPSGISTSGTKIIAFTAQPRPGTDAKPKR